MLWPVAQVEFRSVVSTSNDLQFSVEVSELPFYTPCIFICILDFFYLLASQLLYCLLKDVCSAFTKILVK